MSSPLTIDSAIYPGIDLGASLGAATKRWQYVYTDGYKDGNDTLRIYTPVNNSTTITGRQPDGASSVGVILDTNSLTTVGSKLLSIRNNGVEKAYFDKDGNFRSANTSNQGLSFAGASTSVVSGVGSSIYLSNQQVNLVQALGAANGATAVSVAIDSPSYSTVGAKLLSIRNNAVEKTYFDKDGAIFATGGSSTINGLTTTNFLVSVGNFYPRGGFILNDQNSTLTISDSITDGATAVAIKLMSGNTLATSGARIVSVYNNLIEKAYIDKDGFTSGSGFTAQSSGYGFAGNNGLTQGLAASGANTMVTAGGDAFNVTLQSSSGVAFGKAQVGGLTSQLGTTTTLQSLVGVVNVNTTSTGNTGTSETDLTTYSLPANALNANGKGVRITAWGTLAANANTKQVRLYFGSTMVVTSFGGAFNAGGWRVRATVIRTGATTQTAVGEIGYETNGQIRIGAVTTPAETLSNTVTLKVTGQSGTASNDITAKGFMVEVIN